jgi:putative FmdB family regulatory protein
MPIYEYQCESCGHSLEALQRLSDDPLVDCPVCAKPALKKQISAAGFRLKGGGWYETDFKSGNKKNLAGDSSGSGSSSGGNAAPSAGTSSAPAAATSVTKTKAAE